MELAALGPATVLCESLIYFSTFLAVATTNLQATALANRDRSGAQKVPTVLPCPPAFDVQRPFQPGYHAILCMSSLFSPSKLLLKSEIQRLVTKCKVVAEALGLALAIGLIVAAVVQLWGPQVLTRLAGEKSTEVKHDRQFGCLHIVLLFH